MTNEWDHRLVLEPLMPDVPLPPIRPGYGWSVEIDYPAGFLQAGEGVRTKLRRYVGDPDPVVPGDSRDADPATKITWELTEAETANLPAGTYYAEAEIYTVATPADKGQFLTDNRYVIRCQDSVSE